MCERVLGMNAILAAGETSGAGSRVRKSSAGYDLAHLFVGSEAPLGVITEVTLRLARKPVAISAPNSVRQSMPCGQSKPHSIHVAS